jgi:hypothetical protein
VRTGADPSRLRSDLATLLQESDPDRPLDSLETVVVQTYLTNHGLAAGGLTEDRPRTIEGWITWVAQRSLDS